jgi:hypothetical protein
VAKHHGVKAFINMAQMTVSQMSITETTLRPQHKLHWLAEQAELVRSAGCARSAVSVSRRLLPDRTQRGNRCALGDRKNYDEIPENATRGQVSPRIFSITVKRDCPVRSMQVPRHTFPAETGNTNSTRDLDRRGT